MKFPKYLVEADFSGLDTFSIGMWPSRPLWAARTRTPFALARVDFGERGSKNEVTIWPHIIDGDPLKVVDQISRALLLEYDIYPGDIPPPKLAKDLITPPDFLHMVRPGSDAEFILQPHRPLLWYVRLDDRLNTQAIEWVNGFGFPPNFPDDTRAVEEFVMNLR